MVEIREQKPVVFDYEEPLSKVAAELAKIGTCVIITKDGKYEGIIDDRCITRMPPDPSKAKAGTYAVPAPAIERGTSLLEICRLFYDSPFKALPVIEKEKPSAVVGRAEVLLALAKENLLPKGKVADFMSAPAATIPESASIAAARARLREKNVKRLIVVDESGRFSGVIGTYELSTALAKPKDRPPLARERLGLSEQPVSSLKREPVDTIAPDASLADAALLMADKNVSTLVVLGEDERPLGLISAKDIFGNILVVEEPRTELSGFDAEDRESMSVLRAYLDRFLAKYGKAYTIQKVRITAKKQRKKGARHLYSLTGSVQTAKERVNASIQGWDLKLIFHTLLDELAKLLERAARPTRRRAGLKAARAGL
ncbi:MAG: CBS domain-containing protein [Candidatus Micrarchaeia archaeon]